MSATALAQVPDPEALPVDLTWQGPDACTGASQTLIEIRQMLGSDRVLAIPARIAVNVQAQPSADGKWSIRVTTIASERAGERQLTADSCDDARRAVALLVALMLDPDARFTEPQAVVAERAPATEPAATTPAKQTQPKATAAGARRAPAPVDDEVVRARPRAFVGAYLVADEGTLPAIGLGGRLAFGINARPWALALRGHAWAPRSAEYRGVPGSGARFSSHGLELAACGFAIHQRDIAIQLCLGPALDVFAARSYGVSSPASATKLAWGFMGELALGYRIVRGVSIRVGLQCQARFQAPKFVVENLGLIFQPRGIAERVSVGPEFQF